MKDIQFVKIIENSDNKHKTFEAKKIKDANQFKMAHNLVQTGSRQNTNNKIFLL